MKVTLRQITAVDRDWLAPAFKRYLSEIAPDAELGPIDRWWQEVEREAIAIQTPKIAGFAMLRVIDKGIWDLSEFYILPEARRAGIGRAAVHALLGARPGTWQLGVVKRGPARAFWSDVLPKVAGLRDLAEHPPLYPAQIIGYRFTITEGTDV